MSNQSDQNNTASPSPSPPPSLPRVRPVDKSAQSTLKKVEKHTSPSTPPPVDIKALEKGLSGFNWAELDRAIEILRFFDDALIPFVKRSNVDANVIAMLRIALATRLSEIVLRKYQMTSTSFN